jgi:hypothetical protein
MMEMELMTPHSNVQVFWVGICPPAKLSYSMVAMMSLRRLISSKFGRTIAVVLMPGNLEDTKNKYIYVNSFTLTQNRILGVLEGLTGDHFAIEHAKKAELSKRGLEPQNFAGEKGENVYASISSGVIVAAIYGHGGFNNFSKTQGLWNKRLGLPEEDLEGSLVQILRESGGH